MRVNPLLQPQFESIISVLLHQQQICSKTRLCVAAMRSPEAKFRREYALPIRRYCALLIPPNGEQTKVVRSHLGGASIRQLTFQPRNALLVGAVGDRQKLG